MVATLTFDTDRLAALAPEGLPWPPMSPTGWSASVFPFAEAHEVAGTCVRYCEAHGLELSDLTPAHLPEISPRLTDELLTVLTVAGSIPRGTGIGGACRCPRPRAAGQAQRAMQQGAEATGT